MRERVRMMRRRALVVLPFLVVGFFAGPDTTTGAIPSWLRSWPDQGHVGDTIYLSGGGFAPRTKVFITMACPNYYDSSVDRYHNRKVEYNGPTTDARGEFKAFPFQVLELHELPASGCVIYASDGANPYGPDFPATFTILQSNVVPTDICERKICVNIKASPLRVRAGLIEAVHVRTRPGAAGARTDITVNFRGSPPLLRHMTLDTRGAAKTQFRVVARVVQPLQAQVQVRVRLGNRATTASSQFFIVR